MFKIGELSKITKISTRMLRYYDEEDILKPSQVEENGYRLYSDEDLMQIHAIKRLRKFHFSYNEIKMIFKTQQMDNPQIYMEKLESLKATAGNYDALISELETFEQNKSKSKFKNPYEVQISVKAPCNAIQKRTILKQENLSNFINDCYQKLSTEPVTFLGIYQIMFYELETLDEGYFDVAYHQPTVEHAEIQGFDTKVCEAAEVISTIHYGTYEELDQAYSVLTKWAQKNAYEIIGPFTEKYFVDSFYTSDGTQFITEISVQVMKRLDSHMV
jgi:DNA-binding transcriptional MerR regulator